MPITMKFSLFIGLCMTMLVYSTHCHAQSLYVAFTGNNVSNAVDFDDPCLDSSNVVSVIWRPLSSVAFMLVGGGSPNLCAGQCRSVGVNFTGTPPFTLTYSTPFGGSTTQTFNLGIGAFQVCAPANAAPGSLIVQATKLVDNWCACE
jgi:hypothetical protein